jgi:dienelactone hydrolase
MTAMPAEHPFFLDLVPDPVFVTVHRPEPSAARGTAVLLVPPFGWEDACSYRVLRAWAGRLAADGHRALRITLPGTGDSGGSPRDPDRLAAWTAAVSAAAGWLAAEPGVQRTVAIGIGLGGSLAWLAAAGGAPIDDLVLWGTPARTRSLVRQVRAFGELERAQIYRDTEPRDPAAGDLEAGGFVMTAQTASALTAVELPAVALPGASTRRVLALERDGIAADARLVDHLREAGADLAVAPGPGYAEMSSHPQLATPPREVIETVARWLDEASAAPRAAAATQRPPAVEPAAEVATATIAVGDVTVRETPVTIPTPSGDLRGIITVPLARAGDGPEHPLCVVLLNPGASRRIGPNRMWVEAARRWAAAGVATLRLDVEAIGDSDGAVAPYADDASLYAPGFVPQVLAAVAFLRERGVSRRFVAGGLCSGAYWSLHAALAEPGIEAALLINPRILVWSSGVGAARDLRAVLSPPYSLARIRRVATARRVRTLALWLLATPVRWLRRRSAPAATPERELKALLDRVIASGKRVAFLFSVHEPVDAELRRSGDARRLAAAPGVSFTHIPVRDHTMRPVWAQREAHAALDAAVLGELHRARTVDRAGAPAGGRDVAA